MHLRKTGAKINISASTFISLSHYIFVRTGIIPALLNIASIWHDVWQIFLLNKVFV